MHAVFEVFLEAALQLRGHPLIWELQARAVPTEPYPCFVPRRHWRIRHGSLAVCDHGIVLFDRREVLARKLASLRALGSRRMELADGSWYWDLKPDRRPGEVIAL